MVPGPHCTVWISYISTSPEELFDVADGRKIYICQKAMQRICVLRRMKTFHVDTDHLVDTYTKEIRFLLELASRCGTAASLRSSAETLKKSKKNALFIIFGVENYIDYNVACTLAELDPLNLRGEQICLKFSKRRSKRRTLCLQEI